MGRPVMHFEIAGRDGAAPWHLAGLLEEVR
jgi:hypothetical protein